MELEAAYETVTLSQHLPDALAIHIEGILGSLMDRDHIHCIGAQICPLCYRFDAPSRICGWRWFRRSAEIVHAIAAVGGGEASGLVWSVASPAIIMS